MKITFNFIAAFLFGLAACERVKADEECQCISAHITHIVNNQVRWVGTCFSAEGDKKSVDMVFSTPEEADDQTKRFMLQHQVKKDDCYPMPDGKMIYDPKRTKR